jgi:arylsulfatase A-like enzyme
MPDHPQLSPRWSSGTVLAAAVALGLGSGLVEVVIHMARKYGLGRILAFGNDVVWMAPLANALVLALVALVVLVLALLIPRLRGPGAVLAVLGTVGAFGPLLMAEQIHKAAALVLAAGIGIGLARAVGDGVRAGRYVRRAALVGLTLAAVTGGSMVALRNRPAAAPPLRPSAQDTPNILLLVLDTVRAWDIGWMGYWRPTTPKLGAWVERGMVFDRMLSTSPWTVPSHATMFTGRLPTEFTASWTTRLDGARPTIGEVLRERGYATAGFVGNYRYAGSASGLDRGFNRYVDYPVNLEQVLRSGQISVRTLSLPGVAEWMGSRRLIHGGANGEKINQDFLDWVGTKRHRPFFAFLNYFDAHAPYLPPAPWDSLFLRGQDRERSDGYWSRIGQLYGFPYFPQPYLEETKGAYNGSIAYLDFQIDSLLTILGQRGLLENTVVIITSDHGEHFGEHGLIQHGSSLYLQLLHVPFAVLGRGVPSRTRVGDVASMQNLAATILDLAGGPDPRIPGRSLMEYAQQPDLVRQDSLFASVDYHRQLPKWPPNQPVLRGNLRSVILDSLQLIQTGDGVQEFYQLGRDPWQVQNLLELPEFGEALGRYRGALVALNDGRTVRRSGGR